MSRERLVLAFGGGKGGVGKSLVCSAVATALAQRGLSVVALDADLGAANLHTLLGLVHPSATLDDFFSGRVSRLDEICLPTDIDGLRVISGAAAILRAANPRRRERTRLLTAFFELDADVLLLDLGAGTQSNTLDLFNLAGEGLIVTGTEPTAIQNAYAFIKAALFRALTEVFRAEPEALALVERAVLARGPERIESVERLLSALDERSPVWAERAAARVAAMQIRLVVNQAAPRDARRVLGAIGVVCQRYLGLHLPLLGALPPDATVGRAVHRMAPVMLEDPESPFALAVHALVSTLLVDARRTRIDDVMGQFEFDPPAADEVVPRDGDRPDSLGEALRAAGVAQPGSHGTRAGGVRSTGGSQPALHVGPAAPAPQAPGGERPEASAAVGATEHIAGPIMADASPEPVIERLSVVSPEPGQAPVSAVVGSPAAPESVVEAAPAVVLELVPESALEPETAPEPAPDPASEPEPDPEPAVTALAQAPEPASEPEPDPEPTVTGTAAPPEPVAVLAPAPEPASEPAPNPEPAVTGTAAPAELAPEGAAEPSDALAGEWALELAPETPARLETAAASETMVGPPLQDASPSSVEPEMLAELSESAPPIEVQPWDSAESAFETAAAGDRATALDESSDALIALESTETVGAAAPIPGGLNDPSPGSGGAPDEPTASASTAAAATPPSAAPTPDETHSPAGTEWHRPPEDAANADPRPSPFHEADVLTAGDEPGLFTESADSDVLVALADTSSGGADPEAPATPLAPNGGAGSASALDDWAASLLAVAGDLGLEDQSGPDGDDPWRSPDDDPLDAATNRLDGRHRPRVLPTAGHDPEADGAQDEEAGPTEGSLPFAAEEESLDWSASDPNEGPVFIPEAFSETLDGPVVARVEGASGNDGHLEDEPRPASPPAEASAPSIGERPTGSVDRSLRAAGFPPMPEFEDQRSPLPVVADVPAADADDWLAGFSLDTLDPDPELEPARSWAPLESVAAPTAPVGVPATEQEGGSVPEPDAEPLAIDWSDVRSSLPPPESETVRIPASTVAAMFGADNDGVEEAGRGPTHPSGPSTARTDPAATDFEEPDEWSGWGALADELHGAPEPGEPRLDAPERAAGPVDAPVPAPLAVEPLPPALGVASLDWPEFGAPRAPAVGPDPALPTLPPRAPVPVMRPTLPALPRVRTSAPGAPGGRSQPVLPGLTPGLAAALAREVAAETMPVGEPSWSDDDDPWGSAELASGHHDPSTLGPNDPRGDRGHFGIGFDQAVSSPDGWVQVVTNDLAPLRSAVRQIVLHGGKTMHVLEQTYAETTPGAIAQRVERTHADLVARVERGGLAAVRAGE